MSEAWVTLATSDGYAVGALVLAHSLRVQQTTKKLHCMITSGVSQQLRDELAATFDAVSEVNLLDSNDTVNLRLIGRPDLGVTFTKIHCWRLTQYTKCVFLDADCLVLQNADELFDHDEFSAVADIGWPDFFNSGVFVYQPSEQTYLDILNFALENGSFDGGDQGLLNEFFKGWRDKPPAFRLPFIYNMTSGAIYTYAAAFKKFATQVKIVHFLGPVKPWHQMSDSVHFSEHLDYWWSLFKNRLTSSIITSHVSSPSSSPSTQRTTDIMYRTTAQSPIIISKATTATAASIPTPTPIPASTPTPTTTPTTPSISSAVSAVTSPSCPEKDIASTDGRSSVSPVPSSSCPSSPKPLCMRVFHCTPPVDRAWRPLRHPPTHIANQMANFSLIPGVAYDQASPPTDEERMRAWEVGHPDYLGADSYDNIQKAIDHALQ
uniref:glycogenin glucosyltransferase n=1 Tax=Elaeophora elaphi TaxID=1147741 RepID=A0A0R3S5S8_9BILA